MFSDPGGETACTARPAADSRDGCPKGCWLILRLGAPSLERSRAVEEQAHFQGMQPRTFPPTAEGLRAVTVTQGGKEGGRQKANSSVSHGFPSLSLRKNRPRRMESPPGSPQCHRVPPKGA